MPMISRSDYVCCVNSMSWFGKALKVRQEMVVDEVHKMDWTRKPQAGMQTCWESAEQLNWTVKNH